MLFFTNGSLTQIRCFLWRCSLKKSFKFRLVSQPPTLVLNSSVLAASAVCGKEPSVMQPGMPDQAMWDHYCRVGTCNLICFRHKTGSLQMFYQSWVNYCGSCNEYLLGAVVGKVVGSDCPSNSWMSALCQRKWWMITASVPGAMYIHVWVRENKRELAHLGLGVRTGCTQSKLFNLHYLGGAFLMPPSISCPASIIGI